MKMGFRTPNINKKIKSRTSGALNRRVKSSINPLYGIKGVGVVNNPKKAIYNKIYNSTTMSIGDFSKGQLEFNNCDTGDNFGIFLKFTQVNLIVGVFTSILSVLLYSESDKVVSILLLFIGILNILGYYISKSINKRKNTYFEENITRIIDESYYIIATTKDPETFFSRFEYLENNFSGIKNENLNSLFTRKTEYIDALIYHFYVGVEEHIKTLKTKKGKINNVNKAKEKIMKFEKYFNAHNLGYLEDLNITILQNIEENHKESV